VTLQARIDGVERAQLFDREVPAQGQDRIERDRGMALTEDQAVAIGLARIVWVDREPVEIEIDEDVRDRKRTTDVPGASLEHRAEDQLARANGKLVQVGR
jgi:hypothetical protein